MEKRKEKKKGKSVDGGVREVRGVVCAREE